jgi:hypothetical protein
MLMMCWFYCIPFAKLLYYAMGGILMLFGLFMLKRGVRSARPGLRKAALAFLFAGLAKFCIFDMHFLNKDLLCGSNAFLREHACNAFWLRGVRVAGLGVLLAGSFGLMHLYRRFEHIRRPHHVPPEKINLRFWSNLAFFAVVVMALWQLMPWVGSLTVGRVPGIFVWVPWQVLAVGNLALILWAFWRSEDCLWKHEGRYTENADHLNQTWTPRDTLWMTVFIFCVTLALSYAAHDVLK